MRIILIGGTGTIGREVAKALAVNNEVITASRSGGMLRVDISEPSSVEAMYHDAGAFDAVVCAAGSARFGPLDDLEYEDFLFSFRNQSVGFERIPLVHTRVNGVTVVKLNFAVFIGN